MQPKRQTKSMPEARKVVAIDRAKAMVWTGPEYPVLRPGKYTVRGLSIQGPDWVRSYFRWSLRIEFGLTTETESVSAFFNFGSDAAKPRIGRQSRYYKAWVVANGEHPRKGEEMSANVFLEGQFFEVEVDDCNRDAEGNSKPGADTYSRITRIISAVRA
ncbi:hypothetical protein [Granulicella arctica]|uniref:hypothetical protein n=1 Tax=Granulicella arctica TaxID=940613 RepID=UPI0021DF9DAB|nr:hypothetical protein [Granulicella arctica]